MTGLRRSELLALPWAAVDPGGGRLSVRQKLIRVKGELLVREMTKTSSSRRTISLDPTTVDVLRDWKGRQLLESAGWGEAWTYTGLVFTREDGSPVNPTQWSRTFARYVRKAAVPPMPAKALRDVHATLSLESGTDIRVVSGRLGHASITITADRYAAWVDRMDEAAAERVADFIFD